MRNGTVTVRDRECPFYMPEAPGALAVVPTGDHEAESLPRLCELLASQCPVPVALTALPVRDWNMELSPWDAEPVFGHEAFGHGAEDTLRLVLQLTEALYLRERLPEAMPAVLGGYSLAGLFSLWAGYRTERFAAVAAVSPSVWLPGWPAFAESQPPLCRAVYLSLGDREERTRHPVLSQVGAAIRQQRALLERQAAVASVLEWNPGNHFREPTERLAKGLAWCVRQVCP